MQKIKGKLITALVTSTLSLAVFSNSFATTSSSNYHTNYNTTPPTNNAFNDDVTEVTLSPYLWALGLSGRVGVASLTTHVDQSFSQLLQKLDIAGMLWLDVRRNRFGIFLNGLYAGMSAEAHFSILSVHDKNSYGLLSGGFSYQLFRYLFGGNACKQNKFLIVPYAGFRYTSNKVTLKFTFPALTLSSSNTQYWTDPIVGVRLITALANGWEANLSGDIGELNASNQYSYNWVALIGYQPQTFWTNTKFYIGYRVLDQFYKSGNGLHHFVWDMKLTGPLAGVAITF